MIHHFAKYILFFGLFFGLIGCHPLCDDLNDSNSKITWKIVNKNKFETFNFNHCLNVYAKTIKTNKPYFIKITVESESNPLAYAMDITIPREQLRANATFEVYNEKKELIHKGQVVKMSSFNRESSEEFASVCARNSLKEHLMIMIASEIVIKVQAIIKDKMLTQ